MIIETWWIYILLATTFGGVAFITRKKVLLKEHALEFTAFRSFINLLLLLILAFFIPLKIDIQAVGILLLTAIITSTGIILRNKAVRHDNITKIAPLASLGNIFVLLWALIFLNELPRPIQLAGVLISVIGIYLLELEHHDLLHPFKVIFHKKTFIQYMIALFLFSIDVTILRHYAQIYNPFTVIFYFWLGICFIIIFYELARFGLKDINDLKRDYKMISITAVLMLLRNLLFTVGLSFPLAKVALAKTIDASAGVFIVFFGGKVMKEEHLSRKIMAAAIIFIGVVMVLL